MSNIEELLNLGIVVINNPRGPSSHQVAEWARNILEVKKAGHLGTLDPDVSGVLPVLLGRATNATSFLMKHDKEYVGIMKFDGEISETDIDRLFKEFTGEIWQIPPVGAAVARRKRKRVIYSLELLERNGKEILFDVKCEAGTYIRTLAEDMGKRVRNKAKLTELRRINVGSFNENNAVSLQGLSDAYWFWKEKGNEKKLRELLHPIEDAIKNFKKVWLFDTAINAVCSGAQLMMPGIAKFEEGIGIGETIVIMSQKGELVAFGEAKMSSKEMQINEKGQAAKIERVIMERGKYPRSWASKRNKN